MSRALTCVLVLSSAISAHGITIETVPVGNPGNSGDVSFNGSFGAVGYNFRIGKYEVTNSQYVEFLNGVDPTGANTLSLYDFWMSINERSGIIFDDGAPSGSKYSVKTGRGNNPVVFVNWYDSIRFANWMHNGVGNGDTESGVYTLLGGTPEPTNGNSITRNPGAKWWLPSEDEWYKAAYHKNDGATGNYWDYPTSTDAAPYSDQPPGSDAPEPSNTANFNKHDGLANGYDDGYAVTGTPAQLGNTLSDVGAYSSAPSPYGTFDQGGNVWEWTEMLTSPSFRVFRGGSWDSDSFGLHSAVAFSDYPAYPSLDRDNFGIAVGHIGFRVATIPEPPALILAALGGIVAIATRRRIAGNRS